MAFSDRYLTIQKKFSQEVDQLSFGEPVTHVYNPLDYARKPHSLWAKKYILEPKKIVFLGMNPGPWGMTQTGIPFGEISLVRDWMGINCKVKHPEQEHPKRIVEGFECKRTEVSGQRLWSYFAERYPNAEDFFKEHAVINYCPLVFMEESGKNRTPDKLKKEEREELFKICDKNLLKQLKLLKPDWLIGVGAFAQTKAKKVYGHEKVNIGTILHPSPASPIANRGWAEVAHRQLQEMGLA